MVCPLLKCRTRSWLMVSRREAPPWVGPGASLFASHSCNTPQAPRPGRRARARACAGAPWRDAPLRRRPGCGTSPSPCFIISRSRSSCVCSSPRHPSPQPCPHDADRSVDHRDCRIVGKLAHDAEVGQPRRRDPHIAVSPQIATARNGWPSSRFSSVSTSDGERRRPCWLAARSFAAIVIRLLCANSG